MWSIFQRFKPKKCKLCGKKPIDPQKFLDDDGNKITVCRLCTEYAERRAYQRFT